MSEQADLYRGALRPSAEFFLSTVDRIAADQWDAPALGSRSAMFRLALRSLARGIDRSSTMTWGWRLEAMENKA